MNAELNCAMLFGSLSFRVLSSLVKALQFLQSLLISHRWISHVPCS